VLVITTFGFRELRAERDGRAGGWWLLWRSEGNMIIFGLGILVGRLGLKGVHIWIEYIEDKNGFSRS
jgi:hypothetical protein